MKIVDGLKASRDFLASHEWTQGAFARRADGEMTTSHDRRAKSFCALGAVFAVCGNDAREVHLAMRDVIGGPISVFNDMPNRTKEQVLAKFDEAIAMLK